MTFTVSAALLDALVLSVIDREDTYGYKITQEVRAAVEISESTLYPVLRRLLKDHFLQVYDKEYNGRNRRYYQITEQGKQQLERYLEDWAEHKQKVEKIFAGSEING